MDIIQNWVATHTETSPFVIDTFQMESLFCKHNPDGWIDYEPGDFKEIKTMFTGEPSFFPKKT